MFKLVQTCPNLFKTCLNLFKLVLTCPNYHSIANVCFTQKSNLFAFFFIHYSSIISNLCCFGFQEQAKYWDVYPANVPSAIISDLEPGVEYSIDVMSINNMGESNFTLDPVIVRTSSKKIMLIFPVFDKILGSKYFSSKVNKKLAKNDFWFKY